MSTQQTPDREQRDHERPDRGSPAETRPHTDSKPRSGKTPHNKKNWDKRTRRRHSVSTIAFASEENPVQLNNSTQDSPDRSHDSPQDSPDRSHDSTQDFLDQDRSATINPADIPAPEEAASTEGVAAPEEVTAPEDAVSTEEATAPEEVERSEETATIAGPTAPDQPEELTPAERATAIEQPAPAEAAAGTEVAATPANADTSTSTDAPQKPPRARSLDEYVSTFDDEFYDSLDNPAEPREAKTPSAEPAADFAIEAEVASEQAVSNSEDTPNSTGEPDAEASTAEPEAEASAIELETETLTGEPEAAPSAIELETETLTGEPEALAEDLADFTREAEDTSAELEILKNARARSWKAKRRRQEKRTREDTPVSQATAQPQPTSAAAPAAESSTSRPASTATAQKSRPPKKSIKKQTQNPTKEPTPRKQSARESAPRKQSAARTPEPAPKPTPEPTPRKQLPRLKYLQSPTLKQAFRNLLKLNGGAAWRATCWPIVTFFVLFGLLALAVVDAFPAVDTFNATINATVHSLRGTFDASIIALTTIGDFLPMAGLCLVVCLILYLAKRWDSLAFFATNVVLAIICIQALKLIFAVPRPGDETLVPIPGSFSFPSAHSFCSLIVLGMIGLLIFRALYRRNISRNAAMIPGVILVVFAILIGISRIYVGVHWPSDVLGGWLLAGLWLSFAGALYTVGARQAPANHATAVRQK